MDDLKDSINQALFQKNKNIKEFIRISDHIRHIISPSKTYPGIISQLPLDILDPIIEILADFRELIFSNIHSFQQKQISCAVDSMNLIALANAVRYTLVKRSDDLHNVIKEIDNIISVCRDYSLKEDLMYSLSAIYNIASYLMKLKAYNHSIHLFQTIINLSNSKEILLKANKQLCQCLIVLKRTDNEEFLISLLQAKDQLSILYNLIAINPPMNPNQLTEILAKLSKQTKITNEDIRQFLPFYALHGDIKKIQKDDQYCNFFPNLIPPTQIALLDQALEKQFLMCFQLFNNSGFYKCATESVNLLKHFPQSKITPHMMLALFFIYYWIIFAYDAIGKPEVGLFYAKEMRKLFHEYPFSAGFAVFLELKCRIHSQKIEKLNPIPQIQFNASYTWSFVDVLFKAIHQSLYADADCIETFDYIINESNNIIIQQEALNYFIKSLKAFKAEYSLTEFQSIFSASKESKAHYLFYHVIDNIRELDFKKIWRYDNCLSNEEKVIIQQNIDLLDEAENYAHGFVSIVRRIRQLKALLIGPADMDKTSALITFSLSLSLDKILPTCSSSYQLKFPILAVTYINIQDIPPCLLFAYYCPKSKPVVVRIETNDSIDIFLDELEEIQSRSMNIKPNLPSKEWWKLKYELNARLEHLLQDFESNVLGFWKCLFSPINHIQGQNPLASILLIYLQRIPQKNVAKVKLEIETCTGFKFPKKPIIPTWNPQQSTLQLLLGKIIHQIPWESLPFLLDCNYSLTRIPSMKIVALQCTKPMPFNINSHSAFYVLNPKGDLENTEITMRKVFKELSWNGYIRNPPNQEEMVNMLQNSDLFVYCGHGSGKEFFNYDDLLENKQFCKSTMLLMGCSSGKLNDDGEADPNGVPYSCIAAGSGSVVANLWNVTDGEIDRFLISLLSKMKDGANKNFILENAVLESRKSCKLKYLTGASPVVYGFPTLIQSY